MNDEDTVVSTATTWSTQEDAAASKSHVISVDAPPFVPRCKLSGIMNCSGDEEQSQTVVAPENSLLSPDAPEFYPRTFVPANQNSLVDAGSHLAAVDLSSIARSPDEFYPAVSSIVCLLSSSVTSSATSFIDNIITQVLCDESLHSVGAQVCAHLSHHVSVDGASFSQLLVNQCQQLISATESTNIAQLVGISLLMGELLAYMKDYVIEERIISPLILQFLHLLLAHSHEQTLRCSVSILQITGAILEKMGRELDHICYTLEAYILDSAINFGLRQEMINLLELRANNWIGSANIERHPTAAGNQSYLHENGIENKVAAHDRPMNGRRTGPLGVSDEQDLCNQFCEASLQSSSRGFSRAASDQTMDCDSAVGVFSTVNGSITTSVLSTAESFAPTLLYNNCWAYMP